MRRGCSRPPSTTGRSSAATPSTASTASGAGRPSERAALLESRLREFVLNGNVTAQENVVRVLANLDVIAAACTRPGPFVYRVHPNRIETLRLGNGAGTP